jgi:hypothetical protein
MSVVTRELEFMTMEDIPGFAAARSIVGLVRDIVTVAPRRRDVGEALAYLRTCATATSSAVAAALQALGPQDQLDRWFEAIVALSELRAHGLDMHQGGLISGPMLDELMAATSRCRREVDKLRRHATLRLRLR